MIAVTFALPAESSAFVRKLSHRKRDGAVVRGELLRSNIKNQTSRVCVLHTGVGSRECERLLPPFLQQEQPRVLVSSGFCGATSDQLQPGDLVAAENHSSPDLLERVRDSLVHLKVGRIHSAERVVDPEIDRYIVGREHGANVIDMETATIARVCQEQSIPLLAVRVVSDSPAAPFPAPPHLLFDVEAQRTKFSKLLPYFAQNPGAIARLAEFSKRVATVRSRLAEALVQLLPLL